MLVAASIRSCSDGLQALVLSGVTEQAVREEIWARFKLALADYLAYAERLRV